METVQCMYFVQHAHDPVAELGTCRKLDHRMDETADLSFYLQTCHEQETLIHIPMEQVTELLQMSLYRHS